MSTTTGKMTLEYARGLADQLIAILSPFCENEKIEVAGGIRRKCPTVGDIDLVLIPRPADYWRLYNKLLEIAGDSMKMSGKKIQRLRYMGADVDLYVATPETWATLLLIRTGSVDNNIRLCSLAQSKGWQLRANGAGLFNTTGERIAGDTEESIYKMLGLPYQKPEERG